MTARTPPHEKRRLLIVRKRLLHFKAVRPGIEIARGLELRGAQT